MPRGRPKKTTQDKPSDSYMDKISREVSSNQSKLNLILGVLIVLVVGILIYNYYHKAKPEIGPAQQTQQEQQDVTPDKLPGKYTVKEGDTLFTIAQKYYQDGYKFTEIAKANNLTNVNAVEVGQVLEIPKLEAAAPATMAPSPTPEASMAPSEAPSASPQMVNPIAPGEKGAEVNQTEFGPPITGNTYIVVEGDWLSKIAARAYGDIFAYQKIAQANHIPNPDLIEPGMVLTIPR